MKKIKSPIIILLIITALLTGISFACVCIFGQNVSLEIQMENTDNISIDYDKNLVRLVSQSLNDDTLKLSFRSNGQTGKTFVEVTGAKYSGIQVLYVHKFGIITVNEFLGHCNGDIAFPVSAALIFLAALIILVGRYKASLKKSICRYANIGLLGLIIFISFLFAWQMFSIIYDGIIYNQHLSPVILIKNIRDTGTIFSFIIFPAAMIMSFIITASNIILLKREGFTWRNMLGLFLSGVVFFMTVIPMFAQSIFYTFGIDIHNERGINLVILDLFESISSMLTTYLECLLLGTVISALKAAKHIPAFDKDYILILGCQINQDGSLTRLLQSRADRAVEFAKMQKNANGRDIIFVPSGGQGSDEIMPEAEAIKNYLLSKGISENKILVENKSVNTLQNINFSCSLINKQKENANIAFSTTNYHVFRAGCIADNEGIRIEGIGAETKSYFWINAFIREFIATLYTERRNHLRMISAILVFSAVLEIFVYISRIM